MGIWNIKTWYILYLSFVDILLPLSCWESEAFEQWGPEQLKSWTVRFNYLRVQGCFQRKNPPGGIVNQQLKKLTKTCKVKDHWLPFIMYNPVKDSLKISILLFKKNLLPVFTVRFVVQLYLMSWTLGNKRLQNLTLTQQQRDVFYHLQESHILRRHRGTSKLTLM